MLSCYVESVTLVELSGIIEFLSTKGVDCGSDRPERPLSTEHHWSYYLLLSEYSRDVFCFVFFCFSLSGVSIVEAMRTMFA